MRRAACGAPPAAAPPAKGTESPREGESRGVRVADATAPSAYHGAREAPGRVFRL